MQAAHWAASVRGQCDRISGDGARGGITCSSDSRKTSFLKDSLLSPAPIFEPGLAAVSMS